MILLGVPAFRRYDLLGRLLMSAERGSVVPDRIVVVDNGGRFREMGLGISERTELVEPGRNLGVSGAWNLIIERGRELGAERVAISNDDVELHHDTLERVLDEDADLVRAPGFAFFVIRPSVVDLIGWFDQNFMPAYFEDQDFQRRAKLAGVSIADPQGIPIEHVGSASLKSLSIKQQQRFGRRFEELQAYYRMKWGGAVDHETFDVPFDGKPPPGWQERPALSIAEPWLEDQ